MFVAWRDLRFARGRFAQSSLDDATVAAWRGTAGVTAVTPVGIAQGRATVPGSDAVAV
ncbi:ABC transporter permease, partial [Clavibacter michiganensis subsp. insidiosus]